MAEEIKNILNTLNTWSSTNNHVVQLYQTMYKLSATGIKLVYINSQKYFALMGENPPLTLEFINERNQIKDQRIAAVKKQDYERAAGVRVMERLIEQKESNLCSQAMFNNTDLFNVLSPTEIAYTLPIKSEELKIISGAISKYFPNN